MSRDDWFLLTSQIKNNKHQSTSVSIGQMGPASLLSLLPSRLTLLLVQSQREGLINPGWSDAILFVYFVYFVYFVVP